MKRFLCVLMVLAMTAACLPAVLAAEAPNGTATAGEDSKFTVAFTPDKDGPLTVTVGDGSTEWTSDVMYFNDSFELIVLGSASGKDQDSYTVELTAGITYRIRIWATDEGALAATPYSCVFGDAGAEEEPEEMGTIFESADNKEFACLDESYGIYEDLTIEWTPEADGFLYVRMEGNPGWSYTIEEVTARIVGSGKETHTYEVVGGRLYRIRIACYDPAAYSEAAGVVSYALGFEAGEISVQIADFLISDLEVAVGTNELVLEANAYLTAYAFTPAEAGTYTVHAPEGVLLCWYGTPTFPTDLSGGEMTNSLTLEFTAVGQTMLIGVANPELALTQTRLTVEKTADAQEIVEVELQTYVNKAIDADTAAFALPVGMVAGEYVNVYDEAAHTAVLGNDGYYHLDSADGPILLVDMDYLAVLSDALNEGRGVMYAYVIDEDGNIAEKWDVGAAVQEYEALCDENGYYPLTEDLYFFYSVYAAGSGVPSFVLEAGFNPDSAWMFACLTMVEEAQAPSTEPGGEESNPETGDPVANVVAVALLAFMGVAALPAVKKH